MNRSIAVLFLVLVTAASGLGQTITDVNRPRLAMAQDGRFAIAYEAQIGHWGGVVQLYAANGTPIGPGTFFEGESCSGLDIWTSDYVENLELAFRPDGILLVLMQHSGDLSVGGDFLVSSEVAIGAVGTDGQRIDLSNDPCSVQKLIFVGGGRQDRPRMALTPSADVLVTVDGFLQNASLRNVGIRVLDADLNEVVESIIPHSDPLSEQAFHMYPDIATNGQLVLSTWQSCPIIDQQGNANECDIDVQFASVTQGGLQTVGGNQQVNSGDPFGTINIWPSAAMSPSGNSVIVWADTRTSLAGDVFGQRFDANGQAVGSNFQISKGQGEIKNRPEVVMLNNGAFTVAWDDSAQVGYRARARNFDANGSPVGEPFELSSAGFQSGAPALATDGNVVNYTYLASNGGPLQVLSSTPAITANEDDVVPSGGLELVIYPSPFSVSATLSFQLEEPTHVSISVYDLLGRRVETVADGSETAGPHRVALDGSGLPPGAYVVRVQTGSDATSRMIIKTK